MFILAALISLFSVLIPSKMWFAPTQPIEVRVEMQGIQRETTPMALALTTFNGKRLDPVGAPNVKDEAVDVRKIFPILNQPGTFVLFAVPQDKTPAEFVGTPLVIEVKQDSRPGIPPGPMVVHVEPLRYAVMTTPAGTITMVFYYEVAPNTVDSFLRLGEEGYFDGLTFHRIIPSFVLQGGDPRAEGTGGPGYSVDAEFNDRPHEEGVLSMARSGDPREGPGIPPSPEFANSAGSQFFICLNYEKTRHLDRRYTAFGKVVDGLDAVHKLAATPLADERSGKPVNPPVINKVEVQPVTPGHNPYAAMLGLTSPATQPTTAPGQ